MKPSGLHAPLTLVIGPVTITFTWAGDRWSHAVALADGRAWQSVEGARPVDGDQRWPASPVLVEVSPMETAHGPAILGVGLAGRSHFSASFSGDPDHAGRIRCEIACRLNEPPVWLGSTYRGHSGPVTVEPRLDVPTLPATVRWGYSFGAEGLAPLAAPAGGEAPPPRQT